MCFFLGVSNKEREVYMMYAANIPISKPSALTGTRSLLLPKLAKIRDWGCADLFFFIKLFGKAPRFRPEGS